MAQNSSTFIQTVEQKSVLFYDDELTALRGADGRIYVSIRHVCQALSIDTQAQVRRIRRQRVLESRLMVAKMATVQGERDAYVLRVDMLPLFLTGISTRSIADDDTRAKLDRFQDQAAELLWQAFQDRRLSTDIDFDALLAGDSPAAQAYRMAQAMMRLAGQQLLLEAQLDRHDQQLIDHDERLAAVEEQLGHQDRHVTPDQAMQISQAVKAVALELGRRSGRNEYGGVYGELYRRFSINSYKALPAAKFDEALNWLNQWLQSLSDSTTPF